VPRLQRCGNVGAFGTAGASDTAMHERVRPGKSRNCGRLAVRPL